MCMSRMSLSCIEFVGVTLYVGGGDNKFILLHVSYARFPFAYFTLFFFHFLYWSLRIFILDTSTVDKPTFIECESISHLCVQCFHSIHTDWSQRQWRGRAVPIGFVCGFFVALFTLFSQQQSNVYTHPLSFEHRFVIFQFENGQWPKDAVKVNEKKGLENFCTIFASSSLRIRMPLRAHTMCVLCSLCSVYIAPTGILKMTKRTNR